MTNSLKAQALLPWFILFFMVNSLFLPHGLLYTSLLTPFFLYYLFKQNQLRNLLKWSLLLLIPIPFQWIAGFDPASYFTSFGLFLTVWIFLFTVLEVVRQNRESLSMHFKSLLTINAVLIVIALVLLAIPSLLTYTWDLTPISPNIPSFPRLKLLTYEPSYYSLIMTPVFLYFILRVLAGKEKHPLIIATASLIPLILSLSFGVISAIGFSIVVMSIVYAKRLPATHWRISLYLLFTGLIIFFIVYFLWPENPVIQRINNIFEGKDTSAKGRLQDSYMFAKDLILTKSVVFGCGPGQIKVLAHDLIINYYKYQGQMADTVRIPNGMGEMLATYGIYGFILKLFVEIWFFIRFRIWTNSYALALFCFIFIYQFTGSYLTNAAEAAIWAIVFYADFEEFRVTKTESS